MLLVTKELCDDKLTILEHFPMARVITERTASGLLLTFYNVLHRTAVEAVVTVGTRLGNLITN